MLKDKKQNPKKNNLILDNIKKLNSNIIFISNIFLILLVISYFYFEISLKTFFYIDILITFILSYLYFNKSKKISKIIILTNLFIFFYFLFPQVSIFLTLIFKEYSNYFILGYSLFLSIIFIKLSNQEENLLKNITKINLKLLISSIIIGLILGILFYFLKEPIPIGLIKHINSNLTLGVLTLISSGIIIAISEQIIFSGFLYNTYKSIYSKNKSIFLISILFIGFHLLKIKELYYHYLNISENFYLIYLISYLLLLIIFIIICLRFYSINTQKYKGNIIYPIIIHFITDLTQFIIIILISNK